jgi:serine protease AprX
MIRERGGLLADVLAGGIEGLPMFDVPVELRAAPLEGDPLLPVVLQISKTTNVESAPWPAYRARVGDVLGSAIDRLMAEVAPLLAEPLLAANAVATALTPAQLEIVAADPRIVVEFADLDPMLDVTTMDTVIDEIRLPAFRLADTPDLTGSGVRVAVLDSGIDALHPALRVADQLQTCGEDVAIAGVHGTHCAGIIASRDPAVRGVAPDVDLIDVKVLRASGLGRQRWLGQGIDAALDRGADVISMSVAFNHLPREVDGGHGWTCRDGTCPLCLAADNAALSGVIVVVAAGNEHLRCQQARAGRFGLAYDTEIGCPGQATGVITVGSHQKGSGLPAPDSSSGPTAWGVQKPDLVAPGVGILSTVPLPRTAGGVADVNAPRASQFAAKSGTSMAAPIVAGACALLVERARRRGVRHDAVAIRAELLTRHVESVGGPVNVMGAGRLQMR